MLDLPMRSLPRPFFSSSFSPFRVTITSSISLILAPNFPKSLLSLRCSASSERMSSIWRELGLCWMPCSSSSRQHSFDRSCSTQFCIDWQFWHWGQDSMSEQKLEGWIMLAEGSFRPTCIVKSKIRRLSYLHSADSFWFSSCMLCWELPCFSRSNSSCFFKCQFSISSTVISSLESPNCFRGSPHTLPSIRLAAQLTMTSLIHAFSSSLVLTRYCSSTMELRFRTALSCSAESLSFAFVAWSDFRKSSLASSSALMFWTRSWFSSDSLLLESIIDSFMRSSSKALVLSAASSLVSQSIQALVRLAQLLSLPSSPRRAAISPSARPLWPRRSLTIFWSRDSSWFSRLSRELKRWVARRSSSSARTSRDLSPQFYLYSASMRSSRSAFSRANFLVNSTSSNCRIMILLELRWLMCSSRRASGRHGDSWRPPFSGDGRFTGEGLTWSRSTLTTSFLSLAQWEPGLSWRRCWRGSCSGRREDI